MTNSLDRATKGAKTGREQKYRESFMRHYEEVIDDLRSYLSTLVLNSADAEDVFQELSINLWRHFDEYDREKSFLAWARVFAFNSARTYWERRNRRRLGSLDHDTLQNLSRAYKGQSEFLELRREQIRKCIAELREEDQKFVAIAYGDDASLVKYAKQMQRSVDSLYKRISRIRHKLKRCVERKSHD
ncbi:sigma-70 family RNA polymerase sigma factor [Calycomorphotria hydatis]|uniref:RNA polymerase sigma factor n=1 Tax=Calycomorphotria hydatis TaxID=2528027 RepID=A0A517TE76_9PLAN|nr:sigma-70 family RNA polymerase sigma factor [Calycomorphotria hydatis]QDT66680.1 RNA polymerase sigma factor [Calycomorphotria hydatis]